MDHPLAGDGTAQTLAQAIVNTIHEPLLVLDEGLRVLAASRSFYAIFHVDPAHTLGALLYDLGDGQWNIPDLRLLLEKIIPRSTAMDGFEVEHDFPGVGHRIMRLNARRVISETRSNTTILLAFTDVTETRALQIERQALLEKTQELLKQKQMLLDEIQHRVANSLQIIASILMLKARAVTSEEARFHLRDAHQRVMSVAQVQTHLHAGEGVDEIDVEPYLTKLCGSLAGSMIGEAQPIALVVTAPQGRMKSDKAVSLGLIVTELVINAVKYAFPEHREDARITVDYAATGDDWTLTIADNGVGKAVPDTPRTLGGLGTALVEALVKQLGATIATTTTNGCRVEIRHTAATTLPQAA